MQKTEQISSTNRHLSMPWTQDSSSLLSLTLIWGVILLCSQDLDVYVETERLDLYFILSAFLVVYLVNTQ